jgi:hypothetical protein
VADGASGVARVVWEGETRWTATQLLRASEEAGGADHSALGAARRWLREVLADGPRPANAVLEEAFSHGFSKGTIVRARGAEGIMARKTPGRDGAWTWALPASHGEESQFAGAETLATLATLATLPLSDNVCAPLSVEDSD